MADLDMRNQGRLGVLCNHGSFSRWMEEAEEQTRVVLCAKPAVEERARNHRQNSVQPLDAGGAEKVHSLLERPERNASLSASRVQLRRTPFRNVTSKTLSSYICVV